MQIWTLPWMRGKKSHVGVYIRAPVERAATGHPAGVQWQNLPGLCRLVGFANTGSVLGF